MSQTFYLLAERAKNYSTSEGDNQPSKRKNIKETEDTQKYSRRNYNWSVDVKKGDGIIICV